jgi:hypothetical protein
MIVLNQIRNWALLGALVACSSNGQAGSSDGPVGQARISIQEVPQDVLCVQIVAAGSANTSRPFDVVPGEGSVFTLNGLPLGEVSFSGEAFPTACAQLADGAATWVADPVVATLLAGVVADVALTMHRNGQAAVAVDFVGEGPVVPAKPLLFSEYVEGSSTFKALEITALADTSLEGCRVATYFNGGTTPTAVALAGTLLAGESHVLCSTALSSAITVCDQTAGLTFNGDDAIALECDGSAVDAIGQIGFDPGTAWGMGDLSLLDHTLRRNCTVTAGDANATDAFDPAGEWSGHPLDSFEDLGLRSCP